MKPTGMLAMAGIKSPQNASAPLRASRVLTETLAPQAGMAEALEVLINGEHWLAIDNLKVSGGAEEAALAFSFSLTERDESGSINDIEAIELWPGDEIEIYATGDLICKGAVDKVARTDESAVVEISGRSKSADFIDCQAHHPTGTFEDKNILEIAKALDENGVGIESDEDLSTIPDFQINLGESAFDNIERVARKEGLLLIGQPDGGIKLTRVGKKEHAGSFIQRDGQKNYLSASIEYTRENERSEITVKGQSARGSGKNEIKHKATDKSAKRIRRETIIAEGECDQRRAKEYAEWAMNRASGKDRSISLQAFGWRDAGGQFWRAGWLVFYDGQKLKISQKLAIKDFEFNQSVSGGTTCDLTLCDPRALGAKGKGKGKTDKSLAAPEVE